MYSPQRTEPVGVEAIDELADEAGVLDEVLAIEAVEFPEEYARRVVVPGASRRVLWAAAVRFDLRWRRPVCKSLRRYPLPTGVGVEDLWQEVLVGLVEEWEAAGFRDRDNWFVYLRLSCIWRAKAVYTLRKRRKIVERAWPVTRTGAYWDCVSRKTGGGWLGGVLWWAVVEGALARLTDRERIVFEEFCEQARGGGARDAAIGSAVARRLGSAMSAAAVNKMMQRIRHKLWKALHDAGLVREERPPRLSAGARIRAV